VSWYDILVYCNKRSLKEGLIPCYSISGSTDPTRWGSVPTGSTSTWNAARCDFTASGYRLPTEAEWEYACRSGTTTATAFGNTLVSSQANFNGNYSYNVSTKGVFLQKTAPVGSYAPNAWGLYDMHGNVWEWCWDWYGDYSSSIQTDPQGAPSGTYRVVRGGSWGSDGSYLRSARRYSGGFPYFRVSEVSFRVVVGR
jgi:sulfatase modifying factor 1